MSGLANVSLRWKVVGLAVFLLGLLTVEVVLALSGQPSHGVLIAGLGAGCLIGGALTLSTVRRLTDGTKQVIERMDAVDQAAKAHLIRGLQALAAGDLTVELHASTTAAADLTGDELGEIQRHTEMFRDAVVACYDAYNQTAERLRGLVGHVSATAGTMRTASDQMSCTSEEAGKATGEIAMAIGEVAQGAERQARMAQDAQRSAEEIANAVAESAENAERTAEVANHAHVAAKQGVDAAEKASAAMQSVRAVSSSVSRAATSRSTPASICMA